MVRTWSFTSSEKPSANVVGHVELPQVQKTSQSRGRNVLQGVVEEVQVLQQRVVPEGVGGDVGDVVVPQPEDAKPGEAEEVGGADRSKCVGGEIDHFQRGRESAARPAAWRRHGPPEAAVASGEDGIGGGETTWTTDPQLVPRPHGQLVPSWSSDHMDNWSSAGPQTPWTTGPQLVLRPHGQLVLSWSSDPMDNWSSLIL
ncbi:hypothetical protein EYF80_049597 [Liparis tanakae]|uniref:Uncharacterized protein n=1 Tax=Liparis tanakae TaxID=230148 RepID=A0A4Z2FHH4_9TELE|nr:hypothetical protein EYF80_049597 [Liparis tanakae]